MATISKEMIMEKLKAVTKENTDDETLGLIEDISDTIDDYETRLKGTEDWKAKYEENDKGWREKYRDRFLQPADVGNPEPNLEPVGAQDDAPKLKTTFDELFKEV